MPSWLIKSILSAGDTNLFYSGDNLSHVCGGFNVLTFHKI